MKDKLLILILLLGICFQGFINFPSGALFNGELLFWSSQGHDGLWHVALIEEIKVNFPPKNPVFAGEKLVNYHYLVDVLMGEYNRIFPFFSSLDLYFRFFPILFSFLMGISVFAFLLRWQGKKEIGYWGMIFTYLSGSFGWIVTFMKTGNIFGGETVFWASQGNTIIGNPPHAISYSLVTTFFLSLYILLKERKKFWLLVSFLIISLLAGFKVSAGIVVLTGLFVATVVDLLVNKNFLLIYLLIMAGLSNFIALQLMTKGASGFLIWHPWWFIRTMIVGGDRLDWIDLEHKRQHYLSKGTWNAYLRVLQLESTAFFIFLIGNLGIKFVGFLEIFRRFFYQRKILSDPFEIAILTSTVIAFLIPLFFVQKGIAYNNIQFLQYFLLLMGFFAAISVGKIMAFLHNTLLKVVISIAILSLGLPTVIGNLNEFYGQGRPALAKIDKDQLDALNYLKTNTDVGDIILNQAFNRYLKDKYPAQPWPIYAWYSTAYISAIGLRTTYLSDEDQVAITGYPLEERLEKVKKFFKQDDLVWNKLFLRQENIKYLFLPKDEIETPIDLVGNNLATVFENNKILILKSNNEIK